MKNLGWCTIAMLIPSICAQAFASGFPGSAKGDFLDNRFVAYGFDPITKVISGYLVALRTAPGRTDECKMTFKGGANALSVKYLEGTWVGEDAPRFDQRTSIKIERNEPVLKFHRESLGGECDWILPFVLASEVREIGDEFVVSMKVQNSGDRIGVYVISAEKAKLYGEPVSTSVKNAYLVKGDVVYVYEERPDWYFVRYDNGRRKTVGWVRKSDTVQP